MEVKDNAGKHVNCFWQLLVDFHSSNKWLYAERILVEAEGFMCAIQDGVAAVLIKSS